MNQYFRTCSRIPRNTWIAILFFDKEELDQRPMRTIPSHLQCKKPFTNGRTKRAVCKTPWSETSRWDRNSEQFC